ncbi:hypothetical protein E2C01_083073 [Portunus trituberculatus]|uniref:Uncharacterized protein n=1 Tax=Portunus trituberculatus TaxID=210409 RepID=A0A5B7J5F3_PORTR|nr:hypothetical protein [Portunus trituberculatus]
MNKGKQGQSTIPPDERGCCNETTLAALINRPNFSSPVCSLHGTALGHTVRRSSSSSSSSSSPPILALTLSPDPSLSPGSQNPPFLPLPTHPNTDSPVMSPHTLLPHPLPVVSAISTAALFTSPSKTHATNQVFTPIFKSSPYHTLAPIPLSTPLDPRYWPRRVSLQTMR